MSAVRRAYLSNQTRMTSARSFRVIYSRTRQASQPSPTFARRGGARGVQHGQTGQRACVLCSFGWPMVRIHGVDC